MMDQGRTVFQNKLAGLRPNRQELSQDVINVPKAVQHINKPPFLMSPTELNQSSSQRQVNKLQSLCLIQRPSFA